jgi:diguanylate cyclase (GGDEF)-like protein
VLTLYRADPDSFTPDHLRILEGINSKIGLSCENAMKYRAMEESATTDYLTGLNNARALVESLNRELSRCERDGLPLTLIVCDLDHFKEVNDRFGHSAGNQVLQEFAKGLLKIRRDYDVTARFGGDEFVLVLPNMKADAAASRIAALSTLAAEVCRTVCGESVISASVGLASFPTDGVTPDQLLGEADLRMYAQKTSRRQERPINRVTEAQAVAAR